MRFDSITLEDQARHAAGEEEGPHLQGVQALQVPQAVGDGAGQLVDVEAPAAVGARGQDHAERERDKDGVRFTTSMIHPHLVKHGACTGAAGEEERPHLQGVQAREVPQAGGDGAV